MISITDGTCIHPAGKVAVFKAFLRSRNLAMVDCSFVTGTETIKCCGVVVSAAISDSFLYTLLYFLFLLEEKTLFSHLDNNYYENN